MKPWKVAPPQRCGACGQVMPGASLFALTVQPLPDGRARWVAPDFYGAVIHECPPPGVVAEAEAILREAAPWT